jgi:hypothetical protein
MSARAGQLAAIHQGQVVALLAQPGITVGMVKGASATTLDLAAFKAFSLSKNQTNVEVMNGIDPKMSGAMRVQDLAPGFGAVRLMLSPADNLKQLKIALSKVAASARRINNTTMCHLNLNKAPHPPPYIPPTTIPPPPPPQLRLSPLPLPPQSPVHTATNIPAVQPQQTPSPPNQAPPSPPSPHDQVDARVVDACICPAMSCAGEVNCTNNKVTH